MGPTATGPEIARIHRAARRLDAALTAVAVGALAFSTVTVGALAIEHGVPALIAWLLEPLVGVALWAGLSSDAVLAGYGRTCGWQARALRFFTGAATLVTNVWGSVFASTGSGGLRLAVDPTGMVLHAIAPVLLILLAEAAPRYRSQFAAIIAELQSSSELASATPGAAHPRGSSQAAADAELVPGAAVPPPDDRDHPTGGRGARGQRIAAREEHARAIIAAEPAISGAELARRLGENARTGQRLLHQIITTTTPGSTSGVSADSPRDGDAGEVLG